MSKYIDVVDNFEINNHIENDKNNSKIYYIGDREIDYIFDYFNKLNNDNSHKITNDDICTPMECVKKMIDYIPSDFWKNKNLKILDPCCGNGNFGRIVELKQVKTIFDITKMNLVRYNNCKTLLNPKNIQNNNFFELTDEWNNHFDLIMANPPYSGGGNKNKSLSNHFIEKSMDMLNDGGYLCFITPNNWMT
ncbi:Eco57I restriction-modification methylase domain-containing protein [Metamycoplasma gateae]|uniref:site-specific DNA-methyltransferase (adenine-specific) n=1 Tax=Metamycoplasma gateae TaxID=35769 RepID=A0ABZ2AMN9_9BACT|nr:methyltransferase [Metamycoplasma gateae]